MDNLNTQDQERILRCLQDGPKTSSEMAALLRMTPPRANALLLEMSRRGRVYAPRCTIGPRGNTVNLWVLPAPLESPS
ncbi:MAG: hypothetical protein ACYCQM_10165 [Acidithiobacillus sp.]